MKKEVNAIFWKKKKEEPKEEKGLPRWLQRELAEHKAWDKKEEAEIDKLMKEIEDDESTEPLEDPDKVDVGDDEEDSLEVEDPVFEEEEEQPEQSAAPTATSESPKAAPGKAGIFESLLGIGEKKPSEKAPKEEPAVPVSAPVRTYAPTTKRVVSISKEKESMQGSFDNFFDNPLDPEIQGKLFTAIESYINVMTKVKEAKEDKERKSRLAEQEEARKERRLQRSMSMDVDLSEEKKTRASIEASFRYFQKYGRLP